MVNGRLTRCSAARAIAVNSRPITERDIHRMILRQAALLGLAGAALGGCLAAIARPLVSRLAQDVSIPLGSAIATTGLLLGLVTLAAWLPARRAARIPPTLALRGE